MLQGIVGTLALVNLGVALFNLVPGLPLDGGRLLRAALWRLTGSYGRATRIASAGADRGGRHSSCSGSGWPSWADELAGLWYVPMGVFLWFLAGSAGRRTHPGHHAGALALEDREGQAPQPRP